jgi:hypothetical protein
MRTPAQGRPRGHLWLRSLTVLTLAAAVATPATIAVASSARHHAHRAGAPRARGNGNGSGSVAAAAKANVAQLVQNGTINQGQADVIDRQIDAGSVDPKQLVDSGVVTATQMRAVANAIDQAKQNG